MSKAHLIAAVSVLALLVARVNVPFLAFISIWSRFRIIWFDDKERIFYHYCKKVEKAMMLNLCRSASHWTPSSPLDSRRRPPGTELGREKVLFSKLGATHPLGGG